MAPREPRDDVDGGWAWVVLLGGFLTFCISGGFSYTNGVFFVSMLQHFGHSHAYTSWMISLAASFFQLAGPVGCGLIPSLGCRGTMVVGAVVMSAGYIISAFASSFLTVLVSYGVIMAVGQCFTYCSTIVVLSHYFTRLHALATSVAMTGNGVGTFVMGHLLEYLTITRGWRETFVACAAMSLQLCVVGFCFFPLQQNHSQKSADNLGRENKTSGMPDKAAAAENGPIQHKEMTCRELSESNYCYGEYPARDQRIYSSKNSDEEMIENIHKSTNDKKELSTNECNSTLDCESSPRSKLLEPPANNHGVENNQTENNIHLEKGPEETTLENSSSKAELTFEWQLKHISRNVLARWDSRDLLAQACLARSRASRPPQRSPLLGDQLYVSGNPHSFCTLSMVPTTELRSIGNRHDGTNKPNSYHEDVLYNQPVFARSCKNFVDIGVTTENLMECDRQSKTGNGMKIALEEHGSLTNLHSRDSSASEDTKANPPDFPAAHLEVRSTDDRSVAATSKSTFHMRKLFPDWDEESVEECNGRSSKAVVAETGPRDSCERANRINRLTWHHPHVWCLGVSTMLVQMAASTYYGLCKDMLLSAGVGEAYPVVLSIMGTADLLSRLITGLLCTLQVLDVTVLYMMSMVGISMALLLYAALLHHHTTAVWLFYLPSAAFACCYSASNVLLAVVPAQRFGREQLAQIFGVQLFWCGIGAFCGPIVGGFLVDSVDSYTAVQLFTSSCAAAGAACTLIVICPCASATVPPAAVPPAAVPPAAVLPAPVPPAPVPPAAVLPAPV